MNKTNKIILVSSVLLIFFILQLFLSHNNPSLLWDENVYLANARGHLETTFFSEDFRFPFLELYLLPLWFLFGISVFSAKIIMILFSVGTLLLFYLLSNFYVKRWWVRFALLFFFAFSKLFLFWSFRVYTDIPSLFFFILSWYLFMLSLKKSKNSYWYLFFMGVSCAFAFFTRFPAAVPLALGLILLYKLDWKKIIYLASGFLVIFIPWSIKNIIQYSNPIWDLTSQASIISQYTSWEPTYFLLGYIFVSFGISLIFFFASFLPLFKKMKEVTYQPVIIFTILLFVYYLFFINLKLERYVLAFFPLILIMIGIGFEYLKSIKVKRFKDYSFVISVLFILILSFVLISNGITFYKDQSYSMSCQSDSAMLKSIEYAENNIPSSDLIVSNFWPWFGFYGNHRISSPWTSNISELLINDDFAWLFLHNQHGFDWELLASQATCYQTFTGSCGDSVVFCRLDK